MEFKFKHAKFSMKLTVVSTFILFGLLIISVAVGLQYYFSQTLAKTAATASFNATAHNISEKINYLDTESSGLAQLLSRYPRITDEADSTSVTPLVHVMAEAMTQKPYLYAIYIGYENGDFYELINLDSSKNLRSRLKASQLDRWLTIHIHNTAAGRERQFKYYDEQFRLTNESSEPSQYYANVRPWYREAMSGAGSIKTAPYLFHNTQSPGVTYARRIQDSNSVIAIDISLDTLSEFLHKNRLFTSGQTMIFDKNGKLSAHSFTLVSNHRVLKTSKLPLSQEEQQYIASLDVLRVSNERNWPPFDFSSSGTPQGYSIDIVNLIAEKLGLKLEYSNGYNWQELTQLFNSGKLDVLHSIFQTESRITWGLFTDSYIELPPVLVTRGNTEQPASLAQLNGKLLAVPKGWALAELVKNQYPEIQILEVDDSLEALQAVRDNRSQGALETQQVVKYLSDLYSIHNLQSQPLHDVFPPESAQQLRILVHNDKPMLRELFNKAIASITPSEYSKLNDKWLGGGSKAIIQRAATAGIVPDPIFVKLANETRTANKIADNIRIDDIPFTIFVHRINSRLGPDNYLGIMVPTSEIQTPYLEVVRLSILLTLAFLVLALPVLFLFANMIVTPVKLLADENQKIRQRKFRTVKLIPSHIKEINELSKSIYVMAGDIDEYQLKQQELMDSFIKLIAQAIDEKSPYTGGHCARVPELAIMLAESAHACESPPFKDFRIETDDQWREFKIAAWLHDCGKVTTPEHIIDKGSKLETIYNRIHEIRTRFEVLWRDAEIEYWKGMASGESSISLEADLMQRCKQIEEDFAFIARCNVGSEFMDEKHIEQLKEIGQQTWIRHLNDRLGLSPEEEKQLQDISEPTLPVIEKLLADKAGHTMEWPDSPRDKITKDIRMDIPELRANLGEIYNLSISKGTLTAEDRYRINEHIISTINMLEALPLPKELARVPEIAGGHHETLIGTGYPKRMTAESLSVEARILAIADIFEALTASDRPYKKAKTLSEAIKILAAMAKEQHIDNDLFRLFISSGIYKLYASRYLNPEQCDEVDPDQYVDSGGADS